jgi:predicted RNase H-like HicB family nuclease
MTVRELLQHSEEGISVSAPGLAGCWSQGATEEEAIENITDAIHEYLVNLLRHESALFSNANIREIDVAV